jgi:hypothetical protein
VQPRTVVGVDVMRRGACSALLKLIWDANQLMLIENLKRPSDDADKGPDRVSPLLP